MIVPQEGGTPLLQARYERQTWRAIRAGDRDTRRLGTFAPPLREALSQLRLVYVEVQTHLSD